MTIYRFFFVGPDGHFVSSKAIECSSDIEALAIAGNFCDEQQVIEVWDLARQVGRVDANNRSAKLEAA